MKKVLACFMILVLMLTVNAGTIFAAESVKSNVSSENSDPYSPEALNVYASPIEAVEKLYGKINQLPDTAFKRDKKVEGIKKSFKESCDCLIKLLESGRFDQAKRYVNKELKDDIEKWILQKEREALQLDIDYVLGFIRDSSEVVVKTTSGTVAGLYLEPPCWAWTGIPYAKPPVGKLRWKAPQDPEKWKGIRFSTFEKECSTQFEKNFYWATTGKIIGSEDCLNLNVYRPKSKEKNLPVYFWIHGGGNVTGGAKDYLWAQFLAVECNVVVVVIDYRLGALGWINHPALTSKGTREDKSGNFGTLDMIKALEWVQKNIRAFGGNPKNVTVAGESAGGSDVLNLMLSPLAKGLFHKAIVQSSGVNNIPVESGVEMANNLIDKLLVADKTCTDMEKAEIYRKSMSNKKIEAYLRSKTAEEIVSVQGDSVSPFIDGYVLKDTFASAFESGNYNKVPIILGCNEDEFKPFLPYMLGGVPTSTGHTWSEAYDVLGFGDKPLSLDEFMPADSYDRELYESIAKYPSMNWKASMVDSLARSLKKHQDDVYCFFYKWKGIGSKVPFDFLIGAGHTFEIPFFFGWDNGMWNDVSYTEENDKGREALQNAMMSYIASFTASGNPNKTDGNLPKWEPWSNVTGEPKSINFDADLNEIKIDMMNEEFTKEDIMAEINKLPSWQRDIIMALIWM